MKQKELPALDRVLRRLALLRLFLPLVVLSVIVIGSIGYLGIRTLESQQQQSAQFIARNIDRYLDQAARSLDAVTRVAEVAPSENLTFMQGVWESYRYFDTLYFLDANSKIMLLVPPDPRYLGLDMSNLPYFRQAGEKKNLVISRPFISPRTGKPTVYLVRQLSGGGQIVGELSLASLQNEITHTSGSSQDMIFIMDQSGMLLAHPSADLVEQQTNLSYLEIFRRGLKVDTTMVYKYDETIVLGSATQVERTGWVVVDQVPLSVALSPYAWALGSTLLISLAIWLALTWSLRNQLERRVAIPLMQLSRGIGALARGDFSQGKALASAQATFAELTALAADFQHMSDALEARQAQLQESEERYRLVFENSPVSIWEEDMSAVITLFDELREKGITDIETYLDQHFETVKQCAESIKIVDVNRAALALHGAANKDELLAGLVNMFTPEAFDTFQQKLVCLWNGGTEMTRDTVLKTLTGIRRDVTISFSISPGYERTFSRVLVSITDITEHKQFEDRQRDFYRRTILAATEGKLQLTEKEEIVKYAGQPVAVFKLENAEDFQNVRTAVMDIARSLDMDDVRAGDYRAAVGEAVTNATKHANGGTVSIHALPETMLTIISDNGPGIEAMSIPEVALKKGYTTAGSLGMGYKVMTSIADKVFLATGPSGTTVGIKMSIKPPKTKLDISEMYHALK